MCDEFFNVMFWNCHGINNFHNIDAKQIKSVKFHDVICLCETWQTTKIDCIPSLPSYEIISREAIRCDGAGRPKGGFIILIKNVWKTELIAENDYFIVFSIGRGSFKLFLGFVYLSPDLVCMGLEELKYFFELHEVIINSAPVIIMGDFNARIGKSNQTFDSNLFEFTKLFACRESRDQIENSSGKKLVKLMEENLFHVVNGRSLSDSGGEYTFVNANGSSAIDLAWVNLEALDYVTDMEVQDFILTSDHLPLSIKTNILKVSENLNYNNRSDHKRIKWNKEKEIEFQNDMTFSDRLEVSVADNELLSHYYLNLLDAIKESAERLNMITKNSCSIKFKNKPWFDIECNALKQIMHKQYRLAKRKRFEPDSVQKYLSDKKHYKETISSKRNKYWDNMCERIRAVNKPQDFWKAVKSFKGPNSPINRVPVEEWVTFLRNRYGTHSLSVTQFQNANHPFMDKSIEESELENVLRAVKNRKSPGIDEVSYEFYKALPFVWKSYLLKLFNRIIECENIPAEWSKIKMMFLFKKGDPKIPKNYRGIALINTVAKLFTRILEIRLSCWAEGSGVLSESQSGFRRNRSCTDNIFVLHSLIYQQVYFYRKKMFALFVDFESAFDSVPHSQLWYALNEIGVSGKMIRLFECLYRNASVIIEMEDQKSDPIAVSKGLLQGESTSPLLFSLYTCDIESYFREKGHHGIPVDNRNDILLLMFADDMVILGDSKTDLCKKIKCLEEYCASKNLIVNIDKTKIVVFGRGRRNRRMKFVYENQELEIRNSYKYLGVEFNSSGTFGSFSKLQNIKGKAIGEKVLNILRKAKSDKWESKMKLYDTIVLPTVLYGAEVWGIFCEEIIELSQIHFLKRLLLLNKLTPNWAVRMEFGRVKLSVSVFKKSLSWLKKILNMTDSRYPKVCFKKLLCIDSIKEASGIQGKELNNNWASQIKERFRFAGADWLASSESGVIRAMDSLQDDIIKTYSLAVYIEDRQSALLSRTFGAYKKYNPNFQAGEQLFFTMAISKLRCITQLRMATERSMYLNVKRQGVWIDCTKVCPICNLRSFETVGHFLLKCPMYADIRARYISDTIRNVVRDNDQLTVLLSNFNENKINSLYIFVCKAIQIRTLICEEG
jgi:hypothetical protein